MAIELISSSGVSGTGSITISRPAGAQTGHFMLMFVRTATPTGVTSGLDGWTYRSGTTWQASDSPLSLYYRQIVDIAAEPSSWTLGIAQNASAAVIACYRGVDATDPFRSPNDSWEVNSVAAPSIVIPAIAVDTGDRIVAFGSSTANMSISPAMTLLISQVGTFSYTNAWHEEATTSGSTGTRTVTRSSNSIIGGVLTALRPAPAPTAIPWTRAYIVE